jgi:hypothetical protein
MTTSDDDRPISEPRSDVVLPELEQEVALDGPTQVASAPEPGAWVEPIEAPENGGRKDTAPAPSHSEPEGRSLAELWPEPPRKRQLPRRIRFALAGVAALVVAIIAFGGPATKLQTQAPAPIDDEMVVSADDLKNRREVRPDDFRVRGASRPVVQTPAPVAAPTAPEPDETLAERRARRQSDPEDVLSLRARRGAARPAAGEAPWYDGPIYVTSGAAGGAASSSPTASPAGRATPAPLAAAATAIAAVLAGPLELHGDSATVVARADVATGPLRGARFIGTASTGSDRVTIRFRAAVLADGRQARVDGEAQDADGTFGIRAFGEPAAHDDEHGSVLGDVAEEAATDVLSSSLGVGVAGRAVDRYLTGSRARRPGGSPRPVSLPAGTKLLVFLHEPLELGR